MSTLVVHNQIWWAYAPEQGQLPIEQTPYPSFTSQSLQFDVQGQDTYAHRSDVNTSTTSEYSDSYPLESSIHPFISMRSVLEGPSTTIPSWNDPFASSIGLTTALPIFSNLTTRNSPLDMTGSDAKQLSFDWSTSAVTTHCATIYLGQMNLRDTMLVPDINDVKRCDQPQQVHDSPMKGHSDGPSTTKFDLSQPWTLEPSSRAAETQASTRVVRSGNRYICGICFKSHTRPSRAMACENGHLGFQPFVCDGTCGDPVCRVAFANKEHLQNHKLPSSKTHVTCQICGRRGWRRNAERHLRSCLSRPKLETSGED